MGSYSVEVIESVDKIPAAEWNHVLDNSELATVYHDIGYLKAIEGGYQKDSSHVVAYKDGNLVGLLPNFLADISKGTPFTRLVSLQPGTGGPVVVGDELEVLEALCEGVEEFTGGKRVSQTIRAQGSEFLPYDPYLRDRGYRTTIGAEFEISLKQQWDEIMSGMSKDRRYDIRKAVEQPFEITRLRTNRESMREFYDAYERKMKELDSPIKPWNFFETLAVELPEKVMLLAADVDGGRRGYHFYFNDEYRSKIRHQWMAVLREDFEYSPSELMHRHAMQWGIEHGYEKYGFGGGTADIRSTTTKYKRQYGGKLIPQLTWEREFSTLFKAGRFISRRV